MIRRWLQRYRDWREYRAFQQAVNEGVRNAHRMRASAHGVRDTTKCGHLTPAEREALRGKMRALGFAEGAVRETIPEAEG